ncbi:MAG: hypothetical protein JF588_06295 [Caulobacterales bacterium]|nr:hypothetical protein [Caulobacterales bacterium]
MRIAGLAAAAALALAGCQSLRPKPPPLITPPPPVAEKPAPAPPPPPLIRPPLPPPPPKSCVPRTLGPPPRYPDSDAALRSAAGAADRYQLMAAGRILRAQRLDELERAIAGCRTP